MSKCYAAELEQGDVLLAGQALEIMSAVRDLDTVATITGGDLRVSRVAESAFHADHVVISFQGLSWRALVHRARLLAVA